MPRNLHGLNMLVSLLLQAHDALVSYKICRFSSPTSPRVASYRLKRAKKGATGSSPRKEICSHVSPDSLLTGHGVLKGELTGLEASI